MFRTPPSDSQPPRVTLKWRIKYHIEEREVPSKGAAKLIKQVHLAEVYSNRLDKQAKSKMKLVKVL